MRSFHLSIVLAIAMALASVAATAVRPVQRAPGSAPKYLLAEVVPTEFGDWKELPENGAQVVNPQTQQMLDKIYSQVLTRTYVNSSGYRVMLSLAYGDDQRGDLQAHKPEVCYPAQGFQLTANDAAAVNTPFGAIPARRLNTNLGARTEPVTYWFTMGERAATTRLQQRLVSLRLGLTGQVPDGLLFRVSSIDGSPDHAFQAQDAFVGQLLNSVSPKNRTRLSGLSANNGI